MGWRFRLRLITRCLGAQQMAKKNKPTITIDEIPAVRRNLFHAAHTSVEPWHEFQWHPSGPLGRCDAHLQHSSQALAIDFFGTIQEIDQQTRDAVLGRIANHLGVQPEGPWQVSLEWRDSGNLLKELTQTQVDAMAESPFAVILFEAKFGESDGGSCSQTKPNAHGVKQCNGRYEVQTNPENDKTALCALSGKGIRYWEIVPRIMSLDSTQSSSPCPFSGPWYQWMRNLVLASEYGISRNKSAAVVIVYADHLGLPFPAVLRSEKWNAFVNHVKADAINLAHTRYQDICRLATEVQCPGRATMIELQGWINKKIEDVGNSRRKPGSLP